MSQTPRDKRPPQCEVCTLCVEPSVCVLFETSFVDGLFVVRVSLICQPAATLSSPTNGLAASCNGRRAPSQAKHPTPTTTIYPARRSCVREPNMQIAFGRPFKGGDEGWWWAPTFGTLRWLHPLLVGRPLPVFKLSRDMSGISCFHSYFKTGIGSGIWKVGYGF